MEKEKKYLLKAFKDWSKEDDIWTENLKHTEQYLGYIFLDSAVMATFPLAFMIILGNNNWTSSIGFLLTIIYILSYYNFYNWANNGLKAHLKFKEFKELLKCQ